MKQAQTILNWQKFFIYSLITNNNKTIKAYYTIPLIHLRTSPVTSACLYIENILNMPVIRFYLKGEPVTGRQISVSKNIIFF